jgi:hypothetical protein
MHSFHALVNHFLACTRIPAFAPGELLEPLPQAGAGRTLGEPGWTRLIRLPGAVLPARSGGLVRGRGGACFKQRCLNPGPPHLPRARRDPNADLVRIRREPHGGQAGANTAKAPGTNRREMRLPRNGRKPCRMPEGNRES